LDSDFHPAIACILTGDLEGLRTLLTVSPDLAAARSTCGHPTLLQMVACEAAKLSDPVGAAAILIDAGAPMAEPLVAAASVDAREVLQLLLDRGAAIDASRWTPLEEALYWRHLELADFLVARGAKPNSLRAVAGLGSTSELEGFFADGELQTQAGPIRSPFPDTVPQGRENEPQDILNNAFVTAVNTGRRQTAALLLDRGAQLNAKPPGFHWRGTALHAAVWHGDAEMVRWLIDGGADPSIQDDLVGADATGWATHHGHPELLVLLQS